MATKKISELTTTTTPSSSALFPIVQSSTTVSVTLANIAANMPDLSATTLTTGTLTTTGNATVGGTLGVTGETTLASHLNMGDGDIIKFGDSADLQLKHDGSGAFLENSTGNLNLRAKTGEESIIAIPDGSVVLYHDNAAKLTTSAAGATLAGTLTATAFTGNLTGNVTGNTSGSAGSCSGNSATATILETARDIGGVSFNGSASINLPGVNTSGNQDTTGNAATATVLETARNINGVSFNGSANIDVGTVTSGSTSITSSLGSMALNSERLDIPVGFITINIGGTNYKLPYYSA